MCNRTLYYLNRDFFHVFVQTNFDQWTPENCTGLYNHLYTVQLTSTVPVLVQYNLYNVAQYIYWNKCTYTRTCPGGFCITSTVQLYKFRDYSTGGYCRYSSLTK